MSVLNPSVLTLLLATSISTLFGCAEDEKPEPTPFSLSCELTQIRPATIPLLTPTQVEVRAQCDVSEANIEAAKLAVAAATLRIEDTEHSELRMLLSDSGQLTASAIVTASKRRKRTFSIYEEGVSDLTEAIITGSLHVHDKEEDIVSEFGTPEPDACFVLCTGTDGVQSEAYVEGATCECASPTLISFADVPAEYYTWTEGSQLQIVRLDRVQGQDPVRTTLSVELATEPLPFTESQTLVTRNVNEEPTLLWWGLSQAGAIVSVQIPLLSDGFGKSLLSNSTLFEATPAIFVSSMELWQQPEPAPPIPVFLFAHLEGKTEMAWSLVGLFSGVTGASLLTTTPLWGEVTPEEVMVGTAQAGFTRDGFDRNPQHGIDLTLHARAWSVRPDPGNQSQVRITTYLGDGDGLTPEYTGVLPAPSSPQCWNLSPTPGGHLVSHHSLSAEGAGGFYYASPDIDSTFGMAPILDLRGQNLFASSTTVSCEIGTPQSWDGISDLNTEGSVWARPKFRLRRLGKKGRPYYHIVAADIVSGSDDDVISTNAIPIRTVENDDSSGLRTQVKLGSRHATLSKALITDDCTEQSPCTQLLATSGSGFGLSLAYSGTSAPSLKLSMNGDILQSGDVGVWPDLEDFGTDLLSPTIVPNTDKAGILAVLERPTAGGLGLVLFQDDGSHGDFSPLNLDGVGTIVHVAAPGNDSLFLLRADGDQLIAQEVKNLSSTKTTNTLGTLLKTGDSFRSFTLKSGTAMATPPSLTELIKSAPLSETTLVLQDNEASSCTSFSILLGASTGDLKSRCDEGWRAIATGTFIANGGVQLLMARSSNLEVELQLWLLRPTGLMSLDYATLPLQTPNSAVLVRAGDLDNDGLSDVFVDSASGEGVLVGFSDGTGGVREGVQALAGLSRGFEVLPGSGTDIAATAHFGKGTKAATTSTSARPQLL